SEPLVEFGERLELARLRKRAAGRRVGVELEAGETIGHVSEKARLAHLAVGDDVDAETGLPLHDLADRAAHARIVGGGIDGFTAQAAAQQRQQIVGARQAAGVRGQDPIVAAVHGARSCRCGDCLRRVACPPWAASPAAPPSVAKSSVAKSYLL